jgi:hypothetical protein
MVSHRATPFLLAFLILASPFLTSTGGFRGTETQPVQPPPAAAADAPGTIDGAKNPELIPDDVAYRLVLLGIAEPENATDAQKARFQAKIAYAGLNEDDTVALLVILGAFQKQLDALQAQAEQILARDPLPLAGTPDYQQLVELSKQRQPVFAEAMSALPARLSVDGATKLQAYVENEKRGMKYLPEN